MGLLRWFTKNWANTTEPTHRDLVPLRLTGTLARVQARIDTACRTLRGWSVESTNGTGMHLVRRTRIARFADDVRLKFTGDGDAIRIDAESRSRLGQGDFGQNRRNILELFAALKTPADHS